MMKNLSKSLAGVAVFGAAMVGFAAGAMAAPFSVTYTDTVSPASTLPAGINLGEQATVKLILDNGNSSVANQTWTAADVQCVIFTFNNAQDKFVAINYAGNPFSSATTGNFMTDGSGQLQVGTIDWEDSSDPITNPQKTNISGVTLYDWYLDGSNEVIDWSPDEAYFTNVGNDDQVTNWSNPVPSNGICAGSAAPSPAPAMANQTLVFLGAGLLMAGLWSVRRLAARRN